MLVYVVRMWVCGRWGVGVCVGVGVGVCRFRESVPVRW